MTKVAKKASPTQILPCDCTSAYQDSQFGRGKRVHNQRLDPKKARCTVCKKEKLL